MVLSLALPLNLGSMWFHVTVSSACKAIFGVLPLLDIKAPEDNSTGKYQMWSC